MQILPERERKTSSVSRLLLTFVFIFTSFWFVVLLFLAAKINKLWFEAEGGGRALESIARFLFTLYFPVQLKECVCACFSFFFASLFLMSCALCFLKVKENYAPNMFGTGQFDILAPWKSWEQNRKPNNDSTTLTQQVQLQESSWITIAEKKMKHSRNRNRKIVKIGEWREKEGEKKAKPRQTDRHKPGCSKYFVDACLFKSFANCTAAVKGALVHAHARSPQQRRPARASSEFPTEVECLFFFLVWVRRRCCCCCYTQTDKRHKPHLPLAALFMQMTLVN